MISSYMNTESLEKILKEVGEADLKCKLLEVENSNLKKQVDELTKKIMMMKSVMEERGII